VVADKPAANIRRGPALAYNATGGLLKDTSTTVYGRNQDGFWIYVAIPGQPGKFGWMTSLPQYVTVSVNVMDLPVMTYDQPVPAFIQNCTEHTLFVTPGNVTISDRNNSNHKVQLNPNIYLIFDENVKDTKNNIVQINTVTLSEGQTINISKDGKGKSYSCP
jgi:Bacterial SH3 domain.